MTSKASVSQRSTQSFKHVSVKIRSVYVKIQNPPIRKAEPQDTNPNSGKRAPKIFGPLAHLMCHPHLAN